MHQANGACGMILSPGSPNTARPFDVVLISMDMGLTVSGAEMLLSPACSCSPLACGISYSKELLGHWHPDTSASSPASPAACGAHGEGKREDREHCLPPWGLCSTDSAVLP